MGTRYEIYKKHGLEINLDEMSCEFELDISIDEGVNFCTSKMTIEEILDLAVKLVGPLHYFSDKPKTILPELVRKLKEKGYI